MRLRVTRVDPSLPLPRYETEGAAGFDLYARLDTIVEPGRMTRVPANVIIDVPDGFVLLIVPRSSTFGRYGIWQPNSVGVIDSDYHGPDDEIQLLVHTLNHSPLTIRRGQRIAQGLIVPMVRAEWEETDVLGASRGGFGSTGERAQPG